MENYQVIYKQVKRLTLRINSDLSLTVTAPKRTSQARIAAFVRENQPWIDRHRQRLLERRKKIHEVRLVNQYQCPGRVAYLGQYYFLAQLPGPKMSFQWDGESLTLFGCTTLAQKQKQVEKFYRQQAQQIFTAVSAEIAELLQMAPAELVVRKMSASWGRCYSRQGRIILNLQLIQAPMACIRAVILHEYIHFLQPNHSAAFYALLEQYKPDYRQLKETLSLIVDIRGEGVQSDEE